MFFKRTNLFIHMVLISSMVLISCISRPRYYNEKTGEVVKRGKSSIMVMPFRDYKVGEGNNSGALVSSIFESVLKKRGFTLVPFEKSSFILSEDGEEPFNVTSTWVVENAHRLGADFLLFGKVHDYSKYTGTTSFLYIFSWTDTSCSVGVSAKLMSCSTGDILWSGSFSCKAYTFHDAAWESADSLLKTMRFKKGKNKKGGN